MSPIIPIIIPFLTLAFILGRASTGSNRRQNNYTRRYKYNPRNWYRR